MGYAMRQIVNLYASCHESWLELNHPDFHNDESSNDDNEMNTANVKKEIVMMSAKLTITDFITRASIAPAFRQRTYFEIFVTGKELCSVSVAKL